MTQSLTLVKIGGKVIDDEASLDSFLEQFSSIQEPKILVHGGGKLASHLAQTLNLPQTMIEGRRVTDPETLKIATMVYAGLINKNLVAKLQKLNTQAIGLTGADHNIIQAKKRPPKKISTGELVDFGLVGEITSVQVPFLSSLLQSGVCPVLAPITHDGKGQLLNTNADSIANHVALAYAKAGYSVRLVYTFDQPGVMLDLQDPKSRIPTLTLKDYQQLKEQKKVSEGMIPKLDNAFQAIEAGVQEVILGLATDLSLLLQCEPNTSTSGTLKSGTLKSGTRLVLS